MAASLEGGGQIPLLKLRSRPTVWELDAQPPTLSTQIIPQKTDVIIVGAGITGSFLAERLTRLGKSVILFDRHQPHTASTAASTALLQWEIDTPLIELEAKLGLDAATFVYHRSLSAVVAIAELIKGLRISADFKPRETLYLSGNLLDEAALLEESKLRRKIGLPSIYLDRDQVLGRFGIDRNAAIASLGSAEANPILLAKGLLDLAIARGALVAYPVLIKEYNCTMERAQVRTDGGFEIEARALILANGYEMPDFVPSTQHSLASTWAVATSPQLLSNLWPKQALIWEASEPYNYLRTTPDNRIIIGGEDEDLADEMERDAKIAAKTSTLLQKLSQLVPSASLTVDAAWAGFFGQTTDGLPLIGSIPKMPNCYAAFGYGGNGITFSAMAAEMIGGMILGHHDPLWDLFSVER